MRVDELAPLVRESILRPLANFANEIPYLNLFRDVDLESMELAQIANPKVSLPPDVNISFPQWTMPSPQPSKASL